MMCVIVMLILISSVNLMFFGHPQPKNGLKIILQSFMNPVQAFFLKKPFNVFRLEWISGEGRKLFQLKLVFATEKLGTFNYDFPTFKMRHLVQICDSNVLHQNQ
jgi:hypothetical protein